MPAQLDGTFDGSDVHVTIGPLMLSGFSDGDSITCRRLADLYVSKAGLDGTVGRARITDKRGEVELHIMQTSFANDEISALFNLDTFTADGKVVLPISVTDFSGRTVIAASQAWLRTIGDVAFTTNEVGDRIYTLECAAITMFIGGNN